MQNEVVQELEVAVRGDKFYSKEVRKVKIHSYKPRTFVQTDKPIYLPGQTGNLQLIIYDVVHKIIFGLTKLCHKILFMQFIAQNNF